MSNMIIGTVTLKANPSEITVIRAKKRNAAKETYNSVAYFSWGASIIGREISLKCDYMEADDFAALDAIYQADLPIVWDPQDGSGHTYNVEMTELDGEYHLGFGVTSAVLRKNVTITLLILSVAT